jgi:hypothetical protein
LSNRNSKTLFHQASRFPQWICRQCKWRCRYAMGILWERPPQEITSEPRGHTQQEFFWWPPAASHLSGCVLPGAPRHPRSVSPWEFSKMTSTHGIGMYCFTRFHRLLGIQSRATYFTCVWIFLFSPPLTILSSSQPPVLFNHSSRREDQIMQFDEGLFA